jgi:hypothetical protein
LVDHAANEYALALELGDQQAVRFTQILLGRDATDLAADEIQDEVGEMPTSLPEISSFVYPPGGGLGLPSLRQEAASSPGKLERDCPRHLYR